MTEWTDWPGGECPVDGDAVVEVRYRAGIAERGGASEFRWSHWLDGSGDIVAYRVLPTAADLAAKDAEIERLTKIAHGYKALTDSLEQQRTVLRERVAESRAAVATLASEREANAILTAECDRLRAELAQAREDAARYRWLRDAYIASPAAPAEGAMEPDPRLIDSMAMRYRHDFGLLDEAEKDSTRRTMRQLWEEVAGHGFYRPAAPADECVELAQALEQLRAQKIVEAVRDLPIGGKNEQMPTPFHAGYQLACEEILHRLGTEQWTGCIPPRPADYLEEKCD